MINDTKAHVPDRDPVGDNEKEENVRTKGEWYYFHFNQNYVLWEVTHAEKDEGKYL